MKKVGIMGMMGAALAAALTAGGPAVAPTQRARRSRSGATVRHTWKRTGGRKAGYPGQTPEQKAYYLDRAQAKRDRRAINCTENAKRSAEGYHPVARWLPLGRSTTFKR